MQFGCKVSREATEELCFNGGELPHHESFIGVFIENNSNVFPRIGNNMASNASGKKQFRNLLF